MVTYYDFTAELEDDGKTVDCVLRHATVEPDMTDSATIRGRVVLQPYQTFYVILNPFLLSNFTLYDILSNRN